MKPKPKAKNPKMINAVWGKLPAKKPPTRAEMILNAWLAEAAEEKKAPPRPALPVTAWAAMEEDGYLIPCMYRTRSLAKECRPGVPIVKVRIVAADETGADDTARMSLIRRVADWAFENPDATMDEADEAFAKFAAAMKVGTE